MARWILREGKKVYEGLGTILKSFKLVGIPRRGR